jgi:hypothetical protein
MYTTEYPNHKNHRFRRLISPALWVLGISLVGGLAAAASPRLDDRACPPSAECATPDSVVLEPLPFPSRERAKHLADLGVDHWHKQGFRGQKIKIALLDSGFRGYKAFLGKELPEHVDTRSFRADGNLEARDSQHGILCAEILHAFAPDSELLFANWDPDRPDEFLAAVRWARQQGARVLSCSLIMPSWSDGEGNGPVHEELSRLLGTGERDSDLLCFASAGNTAQRHWGGAYKEGDQGLHDWASGECENLLTPWGEERVSVELCWSGESDYQVAVRDAATGKEIDHSPPKLAEDRGCALVRFTPEARHRYEVSVRLLRGRPGAFHLVVLGGGLRHTKVQGSIPFPADGPEVIAVGAVDEKGQRLDYSSCGPNSKHPKPDLVATVPFPSLWRARPFTGTSAASPQAAGLAALIWSAHPEWTANQVREILLHAARDLGPIGHDDETGYGLIRLPHSR